MIRLLMFLLGKDYETCKSCNTLRQQLELANQEKKELTQTLMNLIKPKTYEAVPTAINPINQASGLFSRRRAMLEAKDREEAKILAHSNNIAKPDSDKNIVVATSIETLETELGIEENQKNG